MKIDNPAVGRGIRIHGEMKAALDALVGAHRAKFEPLSEHRAVKNFQTLDPGGGGGNTRGQKAGAHRGRNSEFEHSAGEYVRGMASTNGLESFWAMLRRGHEGTFHHLSEKHLDRYVSEFSGRHNMREADTADMMAIIARQSVGRRLRYMDLIA